MTSLDLSALRVRELLQLERNIVLELRRRELVRTSNKPLGDIAEQVVFLARGGVLEPNSRKSHDITTEAGTTIQVKAMANRTTGSSSTFSPFRSMDFNIAIFLVFGPAFEILEAFEVDSADIEATVRFVPHIAGRQARLSQVRSFGRNVTAEMQAAYARIDDAAFPETVISAEL